MFVMASLSIEVANSVDSLCRKAAVDDGNLVPFAWKCEELYLHVASLLHHLKMCRVWWCSAHRGIRHRAHAVGCPHLWLPLLHGNWRVHHHLVVGNELDGLSYNRKEREKLKSQALTLE
jgi:hypothetical protein